MRMSEKCRSNSDNPLTSRRTDEGKKVNPSKNIMQTRVESILKSSVGQAPLL